MTAFKGGRGKQAPYDTVIARVPTDIKLQVEAIANSFRELKLLGKEDEIQQLLNRVESAIVSVAYKSNTQLPSYKEAKEIANKLLAQKKSKQLTIEKLLQVLYSVDTNKGDTENE